MRDHSFFDWVSILGPLLLSWPLVIITILVFFHRPLFNLLNKVSDRNVQRAKIGPFEIEETEQHYVESLKLLFTSIISEDEIKCLQQLDDKRASLPYKQPSETIAMLERLQSLGFVTTQRDLSHLPKAEDLKYHVELTSKGKKYLSLLDEVMTDESQE